MRDVLVVTQELISEAVQANRSCGACGAAGPIALRDAEGEGERPSAQTAPAEAPREPSAPAAELMAALQWQTGVKEHCILLAMAEAMSEGLQQEQVRARADALALPNPAVAEVKRRLCPRVLRDRDLVCKEFDGHSRTCGWMGEGRLPCNSIVSLCGRFTWPKTTGLARQKNLASKGFENWRKRGGHAATGGDGRRRAPGAQGRPKKGAWLEAAVYEWWSAMRYSVDLRVVAKRAEYPAERPKMLERFSQSLLTAKAKQLVADYYVETLKRGGRPSVPQLRPRWWVQWRRSYGLSMIEPNRKGKVPKWWLQSRFETMILNVARVRAAAE